MKQFFISLLAGLLLVPGAFCRTNCGSNDGEVASQKDSANVVEVFSEKQFSEAVKTEGLVLVDFNAIWCGPCRMMSPVLDKLSKECGIKVVKVDVDKNKAVAQKFRISSIPYFILYKNGKIVWTKTGALSFEALKDVLTRYGGE